MDSSNSILIISIALVTVIISIMLLIKVWTFLSNDKYKHGYYKHYDLARIAEISADKQEAVKNYLACMYFIANYEIDGIDDYKATTMIKDKLKKLESEVPKDSVFINT